MTQNNELKQKHLLPFHDTNHEKTILDKLFFAFSLTHHGNVLLITNNLVP